MAELTAAGYKLRNQNDWFEREIAFYKEIDPNWDLDPSTPDGLKAAHDAEVFSALDELLYQTYISKDPAKAMNKQLDMIAAITHTYRNKGTPSNVTLKFTGNVGAVILQGSIVESEDTGQRWEVTKTWYVAPNGEIEVEAVSTDIGHIEADIGTITKIITTIAGVTSVTNEAPATPGTNQETDSALRIKRKLSVARPGTNQLDSLYGELVMTSGVRRVALYQNRTKSDAYDVDKNPHTLPRNSVAVIVDGGDDVEVATAIYSKVNPGPDYVEVATRVEERIHSKVQPTQYEDIVFNRPYYVDVTIDLELKDDGTLPDEVEEEIKDAIIMFAAGESPSGAEGFKTTGFNIGESIPISTMYTPINQVIGKYGNSYVTNLELNSAAANLAIAYNELSRWLKSNINISYA